MRNTIFQLIVGLLRDMSEFQGSDGTFRVYDFATSQPAGFPFVVVSSGSLDSTILDSARDTRRYNYNVQIVGEKFGEQGGKTQSDALAAMRDVEQAVMDVIDANYFLGRQDIVIRTMPVGAVWGLTDDGSRVVVTITLRVDTQATITQS